MNSAVVCEPWPSSINNLASERLDGAVCGKNTFSNHSKAISLLVQPLAEFVTTHEGCFSNISSWNYWSWIVFALKITSGSKTTLIAEIYSIKEVYDREWSVFTGT